MKAFTVYLLIKEIVSVDVKADDREEAIKQAIEKANKGLLYKKDVECIDGTTTFAGINDNEAWNEAN